MRTPSKAALGTVMGLALTGCGDPCRELSEKVCRCELEPAAIRRCEQKVAVRAGLFRAPADGRQNSAGQRLCADLLNSCTCERLADGDLAACGLSQSTSP